MSDTPEPQAVDPELIRTVTYPGRCIDIVGNVLGPSERGFFKVMSAVYDKSTNKTRATLWPVRDPRGVGKQWWEQDGKWEHDEINPKTGGPKR